MRPLRAVSPGPVGRAGGRKTKSSGSAACFRRRPGPLGTEASQERGDPEARPARYGRIWTPASGPRPRAPGPPRGGPSRLRRRRSPQSCDRPSRSGCHPLPSTKASLPIGKLERHPLALDVDFPERSPKRPTEPPAWGSAADNRTEAAHGHLRHYAYPLVMASGAKGMSILPRPPAATRRRTLERGSRAIRNASSSRAMPAVARLSGIVEIIATASTKTALPLEENSAREDEPADDRRGQGHIRESGGDREPAGAEDRQLYRVGAVADRSARGLRGGLSHAVILRPQGRGSTTCHDQLPVVTASGARCVGRTSRWNSVPVGPIGAVSGEGERSDAVWCSPADHAVPPP